MNWLEAGVAHACPQSSLRNDSGLEVASYEVGALEQEEMKGRPCAACRRLPIQRAAEAAAELTSRQQQLEWPIGVPLRLLFFLKVILLLFFKVRCSPSRPAQTAAIHLLLVLLNRRRPEGAKAAETPGRRPLFRLLPRCQRRCCLCGSRGSCEGLGSGWWRGPRRHHYRWRPNAAAKRPTGNIPPCEKRVAARVAA